MPLWVASTVAGHLAGALVTQPRAYALDMILPVFFAAMLAPLWRGVRPALPWLASGLVALLVQRLVPGYAFIAAGGGGRPRHRPPRRRRGGAMIDALLAGPAGPWIAILALALVTYLCRRRAWC